MNPLRLGLIGCSSTAAARQIKTIQSLPGVVLSGVFDADPDARASAVGSVSTTTACRDCSTVDELVASDLVDAVIIHTSLADRVSHVCQAIDAGLHVLVERPLASTAADARQLVDRHLAHQTKGARTVFAVNLTMRVRPVWTKVAELIDSGKLGQIVRVHWTLADQFRANSFYAAQPGRGTFKHDGGGLLLNQYHANLDLLTHLLGSPTHVNALVKFGRFHPIEVEDEVFATLEYASGAHASIVASTAEPMGSNRLEIVGTLAMLRVTGGRAIEMVVPNSDMNAQLRSDNAFGERQVTVDEIPANSSPVDETLEGLKAFVAAMKNKKAHPTPAADNLTTIQVANAILLSGVRKRRVGMPVDANEYAEVFQGLCGPR